MKVLIITSRFIYGGIEKLLLDFLKNRKNMDIEYTILLYSGVIDEGLKCQLAQQKVNLILFNSKKINNKIIKRVYELYCLYNLLAKSQFDIVHIHQTDYKRMVDLGIAKLCGVKKRIMHAHGNGKKRTLFHNILRNGFDHVATGFCACSREAAQFLYSDSCIRNNRYVIIKNGIVVEKFIFNGKSRLEMRKRLGIEDNIVIGHVGRFTKAKNHFFMIDIFRILANKNIKYRFILVGEGELKENILKKCREYGIQNRVIFFGETNEMEKILSAMDIFIFPSLHEGLGTALIEAQCNGLASVISENIPDEAIIAKNVKRISLNAGAAVWANTMENLEIKRENNINLIKENGFNIETTVCQLEEMYEQSL